MTRTDVMASSRPRAAVAAPMRTGPSRPVRGLYGLAMVLLLGVALLLPGAAVAAEPTSGYNQEPSKPKTTPATGTSPSKESAKPTSTTPTTDVAPTTTSTTTAKASTLPFTGFDLRWDVGFGVLLLGAGISILAMQRRQRRRSER
jgi:hypothetical protein